MDNLPEIKSILSYLILLCDPSPINNDRKHAISAIFIIRVFLGD